MRSVKWEAPPRTSGTMGSGLQVLIHKASSKDDVIYYEGQSGSIMPICYSNKVKTICTPSQGYLGRTKIMSIPDSKTVPVEQLDRTGSGNTDVDNIGIGIDAFRKKRPLINRPTFAVEMQQIWIVTLTIIVKLPMNMPPRLPRKSIAGTMKGTATS